MADVVVDPDGAEHPSRLLRDDGRTAVFLFTGLELTLHREEVEGYRLNLASQDPSWFVVWRPQAGDPAHVRVDRVTLSRHEANRALDAQERVDRIPLPASVAGWLAGFAGERDPEQP